MCLHAHSRLDAIEAGRGRDVCSIPCKCMLDTQELLGTWHGHPGQQGCRVGVLGAGRGKQAPGAHE